MARNRSARPKRGTTRAAAEQRRSLPAPSEQPPVSEQSDELGWLAPQELPWQQAAAAG